MVNLPLQFVYTSVCQKDPLPSTPSKQKLLWILEVDEGPIDLFSSKEREKRQRRAKPGYTKN